MTRTERLARTAFLAGSIAGLGALTFSLAGCSPERDTPDAEPPAVSRPIILQPAEGDTTGPDVQVVLGVEGVAVVAADGQQVSGQGHHHLFIDTDLTPSDSAIPAGVPGIVHIGTGAAEWTLGGLAPGAHRIIAVLAYGNHVPMAGVATDTVDFVVREP